MFVKIKVIIDYIIVYIYFFGIICNCIVYLNECLIIILIINLVKVNFKGSVINKEIVLKINNCMLLISISFLFDILR